MCMRRLISALHYTHAQFYICYTYVTRALHCFANAPFCTSHVPYNVCTALRMRRFIYATAHAPDNLTFFERDKAAVHEGQLGGLEEAGLLRATRGLQLAPLPLPLDLLEEELCQGAGLHLVDHVGLPHVDRVGLQHDDHVGLPHVEQCRSAPARGKWARGPAMKEQLKAYIVFWGVKNIIEPGTL